MEYIFLCENISAGGVIYGKGVYKVKPEIEPYIEDWLEKKKAREANEGEIAEYEANQTRTQTLGDY